MIAKERLYLTADKKRLVGEGDTRAAFLYATPGDEIPDSAAELFKLVDGGLKPKKEAAVPSTEKTAKPAENKEQKPAANKEQQPAENKGA